MLDPNFTWAVKPTVFFFTRAIGYAYVISQLHSSKTGAAI